MSVFANSNVLFKLNTPEPHFNLQWIKNILHVEVLTNDITLFLPAKALQLYAYNCCN